MISARKQKVERKKNSWFQGKVSKGSIKHCCSSLTHEGQWSSLIIIHPTMEALITPKSLHSTLHYGLALTDDTAKSDVDWTRGEKNKERVFFSSTKEDTWVWASVQETWAKSSQSCCPLEETGWTLKSKESGVIRCTSAASFINSFRKFLFSL